MQVCAVAISSLIASYHSCSCSSILATEHTPPPIVCSCVYDHCVLSSIVHKLCVSSYVLMIILFAVLMEGNAIV